MRKSNPLSKPKSVQSELPFWRQLGWNLILAFVLIGILPIFVMTYIILDRTSRQATDQIYNQLNSVAVLKNDQILRWLDEGELAMDTLLSASSDEFTAFAASGTQTILEQAKLSRILENTVKTAYFNRLFIYNADGTIIASSNPSDVGKKMDKQQFFEVSLHADFIQAPALDPSTEQLVMYITRPLRGDKIQASGALIGELNITSLADIMTERTGLGESGETYLVSLANNNLLSPSRFEGYAMTQVYRSEGIDKALSGETGQGSYPSYRNPPVTVLGSYRFIPELQAALLVEVEQSQALATYRQVQFGSLTVGLVTVLIAFLVGLVTTQRISRPIRALALNAERIGAGDLTSDVVEVDRRDEIGLLARSFNKMQNDLTALYKTLEQRVADRTKALATSSEVSRRLSTILNRRELVFEVVEQVKTAFGYYHAHIYLVEGDELVMAGGTGDVGAAMLAEGHKIPKGRGLVGRAAANNQVVLVSDTSQDPDWLSNELLPDTRAEVAVPISIGNRVLGVLDVQHNITNGLSQEDVDALQSIANQVAVAMQNIAQYESTRKMAADLGVVADVGIVASTISEAGHLLQEVVDLSKQSFNLYHAHIYLLNETGDTLQLASGAGEVGRQMVAEGRSIPLDSERSLVARAARTQEGVVVNDVQADPDFLPNPLLPETCAEMAVPMLMGGKVIGVLDVQSELVNRFTDVDVSIQTTLASQVAVALENARSFANVQKHAERETRLNLITQKIQSATTIEAAMQVTARELGHALGQRQTFVALDTEVLLADAITKNSLSNE